MFFKKRKNQEDSLRQLEDQFAALSQNAAAAKDSLEYLQGLRQEFGGVAQELRQYFTNAVLDQQQLQNALNQTAGHMEQQLNQLHADVHKHDMAIENLLDEWEEKKSDEESVKARQQESDQTEQLLLGLFEAYQEQFWNLKHYAASKDGNWAAQIALMEINLEHYRRTCAISLIQECGVSVDYDLHEVIEAVDTTDPALDKTIADIYRCGYLYKGKVRKKARAAAYRYTPAAASVHSENGHP